MSRHVTLLATDFADDPADFPVCKDDPGMVGDISTLVCVPKIERSAASAPGRVTSGSTRCYPKTRRVINDPRARVAEGQTDNIHEEEMKQRKLMERVRYLASKPT
jgi:hypothetical protein